MRFCLSLLLVTSSFSAFAQSGSTVLGTDVGLTFKGTYFSKYLFRGHTFSDDDAYQGEFGVGIAAWSYNLVYTDPSDELTPTGEEYHHSISYTTLRGRSITTTGYNLYDYDGDGVDTQELFVRYSRNTAWNPSYGVAYDIDTYKGYYLDFSLSRSIPFTRRSQFQFSGQLGVAFDLDEKVNRAGTVTEQGFFSKDGLVTASLQVNYLFQFSRRFNMEVGYGYHRANDRMLYEPQMLDREQGVAHASFKLVIP